MIKHVNVFKRRGIALLLAVTSMFSLWACEGRTESAASETPLPGMRTVVDMAGRRVHIPEKIESVAIIYGVVINFMLALDVGDRLTAVNATWSVYDRVEPKLLEADTVGQGAVDLEKLAKLQPDLFIHRANEPKTIEAIEALGIPVIAVQPETTEQILETLLLLGDVFGKEERAQELVDYYHSKVALAQSIVEKIPKGERKTAIMMGSELGKVAGGDMLQSDMIETAGGINLAKAIRTGQTWPVVGMETIFEWNPDYIFCTNSKSADYSPEGLLADTVWSEVTAVRQGQVVKMPSEVDSWEFPGLVTCLGFLWMLSEMYPEHYSKDAFLLEVDGFYQMAYGMTFDRDYLGGY